MLPSIPPRLPRFSGNDRKKSFFSIILSHPLEKGVKGDFESLSISLYERERFNSSTGSE
jgi:hypothetical protein